MAIDSSVAAPVAWPRRHLLTLILVALAVAWLMFGAPDSPVFLALVQWSPALAMGFGQNILISLVAIGLGTVFGLLVGALGMSPFWLLRLPARIWIQIFRNAPWLVLIYFTTYVFPFEIRIGSTYISFPDWVKVTIGLALPASANVAEIFRGAVASIPSTQWEAARSLAFTRGQIFTSIILPQCFKRMLPPWMNLYAVITMGTALASLVGVHDVIDTAQIASNTVNQTGFTVIIYCSLLVLFFAYCYPISRLTQRLERRYAFY
ncbi:amino acid ABC transporter permease [Pseudomonas lijiangensis]|uniref:Amino acid ABC transporter permease n=1 Tax=Pseudomonas lijiangensis TaxID=2995658 RepID=A0ABX8HXI3_9PSED|nr:MULTISPECIES: amino acid ABC transporter permease [Pseudomonas syringae group]MBX8501610.1 amino acid ABC transporter permease [Pseudomonas lijiangensis]MBX8506428.1 amino acid ABC transporter permease [Pseudomonas lijiangensis]MBX8518627.1 amino acid ABC transporter permease [Pseudomonas cichorii]MBX8546397.1 amino acid ABC transporter permease [Pseudomonas cichorii]MBX8562061.1 amino acid ABC transporter permease [Pseudomonas cichorii]